MPRCPRPTPAARLSPTGPAMPLQRQPVSFHPFPDRSGRLRPSPVSRRPDCPRHAVYCLPCPAVFLPAATFHAVPFRASAPPDRSPFELQPRSFRACKHSCRTLGLQRRIFHIILIPLRILENEVRVERAGGHCSGEAVRRERHTAQRPRIFPSRMAGAVSGDGFTEPLTAQWAGSGRFHGCAVLSGDRGSPRGWKQDPGAGCPMGAVRGRSSGGSYPIGPTAQGPGIFPEPLGGSCQRGRLHGTARRERLAGRTPCFWTGQPSPLPA